MKYHNITKADMLNGEGLRCVLWVSGCSHHCPGCHNKLTWDCQDGLDFDEDAQKEIYEELNNDWCSGLTLSGGDPLFIGNRLTIANLVAEIKETYPQKTIWCYTGWTWEELMAQYKKDPNLKIILKNIDVLLEGRFIEKLKEEKLHYVGSKNQRIIDVKQSLKKKKIVLYIEQDEKWLKETMSQAKTCHL